jgi:hypothetical protein
MKAWDITINEGIFIGGGDEIRFFENIKRLGSYG